ncbi:MAG: carbohydrate ABC transporter permease [Anaerolineae bacterium]
MASQLLVAVVGLFFLLPFLDLALSSLKPLSDIVAFPRNYWPHRFLWRNYMDALTLMPFGVYLRNTLIICVFAVIGHVLSSALPAYSLSRVRWPGREAALLILLSTMMLPGQVTMIPVYVIFHRLHMINTLYPLIIPAFLGSAFFTFMLRQFFLTIPSELVDAARVDGCGELGILVRVIAPLSKPALTTVTVLTFLWTWNDFFGPLLYLQSPSRWTISIGLAQFSSRHGQISWNLLLAASVAFTLPTIAAFFIAQDAFVQGISTTGFK